MGLGGFIYTWQRQTKHFGHTRADKYSCLVFDNRGMGKSDKPSMRYTTSEMARDLLEVLDHVGWTSQRQLHVVGVSMGGMISQELVCSFVSPTRSGKEANVGEGVSDSGPRQIAHAAFNRRQARLHGWIFRKPKESH